MGKKIIAYPLKIDGSNWENMELRLSLRSLEAHWKGEYDEVVILGESMPEWINKEKVRFELSPGYVEALNKCIDIAGPDGDILWMNDDIMFLKDTTWEDLVRPVRRQPREQMTLPKANDWAKSKNGWMRRLGQIMIELHNQGRTTWRFSTHTPYWYEADKLKACMDEFGPLGYKVAIENAYFNIYIDQFGVDHIDDTFRIRTRRSRFPMDEYADKRFINLTPRIGPWMKGFLLGIWPLPCQFENS